MSETLSGTESVRSAEEIQRRTLEWVAEMLEEPEARPEDNFLDLGGHSMLALQLSERAKEEFGAEYDMEVLFEKSIADTAAELSTRAGRG
ncbi:acyl carrier protein [Streptomyces fradiae]|uniref:acyl carrier protein n=1 Tax=Streptomyces fradiae TaxID=1906 RepID=UPI0035BE3ACE